jgi:molybdopterin molybdotransferase
MLIARWIKPIAAIDITSLRECLGRVLGESVHSSVNVSADDNSAINGWAIRACYLDPTGAAQLGIESGASGPVANGREPRYRPVIRFGFLRVH